jgi:hypothetical protein
MSALPFDPSMAGELMFPGFESLPSDFLPNMPNLGPMVGELMMDGLPSFEGLPSIMELMPSFELFGGGMPNVGELMMDPGGCDFMPHMPSMPSFEGLPNIGEFLPSLGEILPSLPSMPDIDFSQAGELMGMF